MAFSFEIRRSKSQASRQGRRAAAIVEVAIVSVALMFLLFGMIEFGRALLARHAITSISREAANLASRGTPLPATLQAMLTSAGSANLATNGYVILTSVTRNSSNVLQITEQVSGGGNPQSSRIGTAGSGAVSLPTGIPLQGQTSYVAEVFIHFQPVTPVASVLNVVMPSTLYDVAFF